MASIHCAPLLAAILLLIPAALAQQSVPTTGAGQAMLDQPLLADVALPSLGGQVQNGLGLAFAVQGDKAPNTVNTGAVTFGFTTENVVAINGKITVTVPLGYFSNVDSSKVNTFTGTSSTCKCVGSLTATDSLMTCTVAGADLAAGSVTLTMAVGALTTGAPSDAGSYNVQTTTDRAMSFAPLAPAIGGVISGVVFSALSEGDKIPGTLNTDIVGVQFTVATAIPIGGKLTLNLPKNYFSAVSSAIANTFTSKKTTATCVLTKASGTETKDKVVCTTAADVLAAEQQTLNFRPQSITTGSPQAAAPFTVSSTTDRESTSTTNTVQLGGVTGPVAVMTGPLSAGLPNNDAAFKVTFTTAHAVPIGGTITIALPSKYLSAVDSSKSCTFTTAGEPSTAKATCVLTAGVKGTDVLLVPNADTVVCTTSTAILALGVQVMTFIAGAITAGGPQAASKYNVATSTDRSAALAANANTLAIGGAVTLILAMDGQFLLAPGKSSSGAIAFKFKTATVVPIGGFITIALPPKYLSAVDSSKSCTFDTTVPATPAAQATTVRSASTRAASLAKATCVLNAGVKGTNVLLVPDADTVVCRIITAELAAGVQVMTFITAAVIGGLPHAASNKYNVATSKDISPAALINTAAVLALGSQVIGGVELVHVIGDGIPNTMNTGIVSLKFSTANGGSEIPIGGKITAGLPRGYFSKIDESKTNTFAAGTNAIPATCTCALTLATGIETQDTVVCTTSASIAQADLTLKLAVGAVTFGGPISDFSNMIVSTSEDIGNNGPANPLGSRMAEVEDMAFTNADDRIPGKFSTNNNTITFRFQTSTDIPAGGKMTVTLPQAYFSKVVETKDITVGASTAKCAIQNVAQQAVPAVITPYIIVGTAPNAVMTTITTASTDSTLKVEIISPAFINGLTQVAIPLAGFSLDAANAAFCTTNCKQLDNAAGKVKAALANGVLTLTLSADNYLVHKNALTTFTISLVKTPATVGWATTGIIGTSFNPTVTVVCTTAAIVARPVDEGVWSTFTFVAGSVTIGTGQKASIFQVETSVDLPIDAAVAKATVALGGGVTVGKPLGFANAQDRIPGKVNSGPVSLGATLSNSVPIGGQFLLTFPSNYFTAVNPLSVVTLTKGTRRSLLQTSTLSCVRTAGATVDQITCTLAGAASGTGAVVITFPAGSLTTGLPTSTSGGFNLATANAPVGSVRTPYFPKAAGSAYGVASLLVALSALLACL